MFTGRRPRAFQFKFYVGTAILGQPPVRRKIFESKVFGTEQEQGAGAGCRSTWVRLPMLLPPCSGCCILLLLLPLASA